MVGSHTIFSNSLNKINKSDLSFLKHEDWFKVDIVYKSSNANFILTHYEGYPFQNWDNNNYVILMEGMIYNFSDEKIERLLKDISHLLLENGDYHNKIKEFVENADGDFIIQIYDKKNKKYILFNDYLGRLSLYYHFTNKKIILSRETKFILEFMDEIKFDKIGLAENLMFSHTLGNKTHFQNVKRLYPCEYIICEETENGFDTKIGKTAEFNFKTKDRFWSKKKSIEKLADQLLDATKNRVDKLHEKGYKIISELSGGYDSRAVIGGLCKYDNDVDYYTYEYIQDESVEANQLFKKLDEPGKHIKTSFKNEVDMENISALVYKTDGLANYYTTGICYNDAKHVKNITPNIIGCFGGFGGEFIRHPQKKWFHSIYQGIEKLLYSGLSSKEAYLMINDNYNRYKKELSNYLNTYTENEKSDVLKHFYYEYYRNFVGLAGEERTRIFNWMVMPIWSKDFVDTIFHQIPLKWTGYKYFIDFMCLIDPRLLEAPIYKSDIKLESKKSIKRYEKNKKQFNLKKRFRRFLKFKFPFLLQIYKSFKARKQENNGENYNKEILKLFYSYYKKLEKCNSLFDLEAVEKYINKAGGKYNRLATLAMYVYEIEKRYSNKIKVEEE